MAPNEPALMPFLNDTTMMTFLNDTTTMTFLNDTDFGTTVFPAEDAGQVAVQLRDVIIIVVVATVLMALSILVAVYCQYKNTKGTADITKSPHNTAISYNLQMGEMIPFGGL